ncbi:hypothetical protein VTL71DRAFT_15820 [Oculimacula yallundae]|uniref:Uncharacterized protein n=1 Tax=Oculimacula yallundae TaxID=86028 RepID=A0ABR4CCS3_9HELO
MRQSTEHRDEQAEPAVPRQVTIYLCWKGTEDFTCSTDLPCILPHGERSKVPEVPPFAEITVLTICTMCDLHGLQSSRTLAITTALLGFIIGYGMSPGGASQPFGCVCVLATGDLLSELSKPDPEGLLDVGNGIVDAMLNSITSDHLKASRER